MNANTNSASLSGRPGSDAETASPNSLSPVNWEARYHEGDTPWDMGAAAPPLLDFLNSHLVVGEVLVPGCGSGHDVRALAARGARVIGLDLSATAISIARSFSRASDERYEQGDLFKLPPSWHGRFDWVVEHTCFCAIEPSLRSDYVRAITELLKPGGDFFAIFYLDPQTDQRPPFQTSREEIAEFFDSQFALLEEWVPEQSFEGRTGRELCQLRKLRS